LSTFSIPVEVGDLAGARFMSLDAVVDTGASDSFLPGDVLNSLGIERIERRPYQLADDTTVDYDVGQARIRLDGRERFVLVVFGPVGVTPLLGATTLELFQLDVDPVGHRLIPVPGMLKTYSWS
jgi:clan AA aspartic protease